MDDTVQGQRLADIVGRITQQDLAPGDVLGELAALRADVEAQLGPQAEAFLRAADKVLVGCFGTVGPHRLSDQLLADPEPPALTARYAQAVTYAADLHRDQRRKGTAIPYVSHLLGASAFLLEQPAVDEDQAIAALLHDAIEDHPEQTDLETIAQHFGSRVARIVQDCSDADSHPKPPWRHRKAAYLAHLQTVPRASLQVALGDKLHKARAIVTDLETSGEAVWTRFNAPPVAQRWYYTSLAELFSRRMGSTLSQALQRTVERLVAHLPETLDLPADVPRPEWVDDATVTGAAADLLGAAWVVRAAPDDLVAYGPSAWGTPDGQWWIEEAPAGDLERPLVICVRPAEGFPATQAR